MGDERRRHKTILYLDPQDIAHAAVDALGKKGELADKFLARLFRARWNWKKQSRADLVAEITRLADEALLGREKLIRGYGGNCSYDFQQLYGPDPELDR